MDGRSSRGILVAVVALGVTVFLAHFSLSPSFGLYEDDYWLVAPHLWEGPAHLWPLLVYCFTAWPQGRPLNHFLPPLLGTVGGQLGGLQAAYALAAAWLTLNATLVFLVARKLLSPFAALAAALVYVLFPADSTKPYLLHAAELQGAMTFLLLGTWLWLRGGRARAASYPVAALALLAYETAFLPFLAMPLLAAGARRFAVWARHGVACAVAVGLVGAVRLLKGESRAVEAAGHPAEMLWRAFSSLGIGPWTSGRMLLRSLPRAWAKADLQGILSVVVLAGALVLALAALAREGGAAAPRVPAQAEAGQGEAGGVPRWTAVLVAGLASWVGSYALCLTNYPPTQTVGRLTSTHVAAGFGVALALGALVEGARRRAPRATLVAVVAVLASWGLYHHGIQRQYARAWAVQQRFWRQVVSLVPEAGAGWTVIVAGTPAAGQDAIFANSWADLLVYRALVPTAGGPPVEFAHLARVKEFLRFRRDGERIAWQPEFWVGTEVSIDPTRLALLRDDSGTLARVEGIETPIGPLRAAAPIPPPGPARSGPGPLGRLLVEP